MIIQNFYKKKRWFPKHHYKFSRDLNYFRIIIIHIYIKYGKFIYWFVEVASQNFSSRK